MGNFIFLKKYDKDLFEIINEAEYLYRDEYFEQCMTQTRRFGENVCKKVLKDKYIPDSSFDCMLADLSDMTGGSEQEKEFLEDLYFLKKQGNKSTHSTKVQKDGREALECLQRAFEVAINYCAYNKKSPRNVLSLQYDVELLITGKKSKKSLVENYKHAKTKTKTKTTKIEKEKVKQSHKMITKKDKTKLSFFWIFIFFSTVISLFLLLVMTILANI